MRRAVYRSTAYGTGKAARKIRRITSNQTIPADTHISTHNPPKMCGGYKKGANPSEWYSNQLILRGEPIFSPAGLRGRVILGKGNRMKFPTYEDKDGTNLAEVGTDCISRQAAIDAIEREKVKVFHELYDEAWNDAINGCKEVIEQLPPIQPKRGKWKIVTDNNGQHMECNRCGEWRYHQEQKFCGECGADMREVTT